MSEWVHRFAQKRGLTHPIAYGLDLAVNEALTNIISYAYGDNRPHEISVALNAQRSQVRVEVQDDGVPFNPLELPIEPPQIDLDKSRRTGRGIPLMRNFMDELHYARRDTRNVLVMVLLMPPG